MVNMVDAVRIDNGAQSRMNLSFAVLVCIQVTRCIAIFVCVINSSTPSNYQLETAKSTMEAGIMGSCPAIVINNVGILQENVM